MHEIGMLQQALQQVLQQAGTRGAQRVERVTVRIGADSGVVPEVVALAFEVSARGTIAEGARLEIEHVPLVCYCGSCALEFEPADVLAECPRCGRISAQVRQGREFELAALEIA
jgi:hydrogenase nickel incorporation protein HypA/HybF